MFNVLRLCNIAVAVTQGGYGSGNVFQTIRDSRRPEREINSAEPLTPLVLRQEMDI